MTPTAPGFFATPAAAKAVAEARAVAILVGGYDGSANYGDIAQLDAGVDLLQRLGSGLLVLPVVERPYLANHRTLTEDAPERCGPALFLGPAEEPGDGLVPVPAPIDLAFGACYLYGGGYLNPSWGGRKLEMLRAAEDLLKAGGPPRICRLSSGLQADPDWIAGLAPEDAGLLGSFEVLGGRDQASTEMLSELSSAALVLDTADDAVGALRPYLDVEAPPFADGSLHVNVHFAEHDWVTGSPERMLDFYLDFLAELGRRAARPIVAHPLVAYADPRIDERPALERLAAAAPGRGIEVAESIVLRPAALAEATASLQRASLTLSCSYHVALTSLMLKVPAVLISDNPYYEQKAAGLREAFGLPPELAVPTEADPQERAAAVAGVVFEAAAGEALRGNLVAGRDLFLRRRAEVEGELLGRLGSAALGAFGERLETMAKRLRERAAEPAELHAQLAVLRFDHQELERRAGEAVAGHDSQPRRDPAGVPPSAADGEAIAAGAALVAAEIKAREATARSTEAEAMVSTLLNSRSWRLTAPLRRTAARLRHSRRAG